MRQRFYRDRFQVETFWKEKRESYGTVVFTNGCFDILHPGHVLYLEEARSLGDFLVLGLNSDASVRRLKGPTRPVNCFADRATVLSGLRAVDLVVGFDEDTPLELIQMIMPQLLVKGGDWKPEQIVGSQDVLAKGGRVLSLGFQEGKSTTQIIEKITARPHSGT